jgi:hypothetical protein
MRPLYWKRWQAHFQPPERPQRSGLPGRSISSRGTKLWRHESDSDHLRAAVVTDCSGEVVSGCLCAPSRGNLSSRVRGRFAQFDPEGDGSERISDLDPLIPRCSGIGSTLLPKLVNGPESFDTGLREIGDLDPDLVGNDIVSIHEMEIVALHHGSLASNQGWPLGGVSHFPPRA